jgi:hypothetical protein
MAKTPQRRKTPKRKTPQRRKTRSAPKRKTPRRRKTQASAPKSQLPDMSWFQPLSEPMRPPKSEDMDKIRRDERHQTKVDQAGRARAAKKPRQRQLLAVIQQEARTADPAKRLLQRVNNRLCKLERKQISLSTLYRRLTELKKRP